MLWFAAIPRRRTPRQANRALLPGGAAARRGLVSATRNGDGDREAAGDDEAVEHSHVVVDVEDVTVERASPCLGLPKERRGASRRPKAASMERPTPWSRLALYKTLRRSPGSAFLALYATR